MATILAFDASTDACSVALVGDSLEAHLISEEPRAHAQKLLPMVDELLQGCNLTLADLDAVAYGAGPGSFTGLRIGFGIAQGLAFGAGLPMTGVSSLSAMARSVQREDPGCSDAAICLLDARMGEVYWAVFSLSSDSLPVIVAPGLATPADVQASLKQLMATATKKINFALFGAGLELLDRDFRTQFDIAEPEVRPTALSVAELGLGQLAAGQISSPERAELIYLRNSVSWNKRQKLRSVTGD